MLAWLQGNHIYNDKEAEMEEAAADPALCTKTMKEEYWW